MYADRALSPLCSVLTIHVLATTVLWNPAPLGADPPSRDYPQLEEGEDYYYYEHQTQEEDLPPGFVTDLEGEDVLLTTQSGQLLGKRSTSPHDTGGLTQSVDSFIGVPYAQPPVGQLRFQRPRPVRPWLDVRPSRRFAAACPQQPQYAYTRVSFQSEDCLYLNIYVPHEASQPNQTYAVAVYVHGGSYIFGSGNYYPGQLLAQQGVCVVTINYRLGLLGFWSARTKSLPGNYGLWDQIEALRWLQLNAASFRCDPTRVTIFGNSAGGASVGLLVMSPPAKGLFHRAIAQSGSPFSFWAMHNNSVDLRAHAHGVAEVYSCRKDSTEEEVDCMRSRSWGDLMNQIEQVPVISPSGAAFRPCVDGTVVPWRPGDARPPRYVNDVSFMCGTVRDEWTRNVGWFIGDLLEERSSEMDGNYLDGIDRQSFLDAIEHVVTRRFDWPRPLAALIQNEYTNWTHVNDPIENRNQYVHFFTDVSMLVPSVQLSRYMWSVGRPVYHYTFAHHSRSTRPAWFGSYHEVELNYIFGAPFLGLNLDGAAFLNYTDEDRRVSAVILVLWANFVKTGNPTPRPLAGEITWRQFIAETSDFLFIHPNHTHMDQHLRTDKVAFWTELMPALSAQLLREAPPSVTYRPHMLVFAGLSVTLLCLLLIALYGLVRKWRDINHMAASTDHIVRV